MFGAAAGAPIGTVSGAISSRGDKNSETRVDAETARILAEEEAELEAGIKLKLKKKELLLKHNQ